MQGIKRNTKLLVDLGWNTYYVYFNHFLPRQVMITGAEVKRKLGEVKGKCSIKPWGCWVLFWTRLLGADYLVVVHTINRFKSWMILITMAKCNYFLSSSRSWVSFTFWNKIHEVIFVLLELYLICLILFTII